MMRGRLRRFIKRNLVLQTPHEDAECQSDERECAHTTKWPIFAPKMHSRQNLTYKSTNVSCATRRRSEETLCSLIAHPRKKVAQLFLFVIRKIVQCRDAARDYPELSLKW
jgi:hypothetical protein